MSLAAPTSGASVSGTVNLSATASDNVGVTQVLFFVDKNTKPLGTDTSPDPTSGYYSASWNSATVSNGLHTLKVVAYDAAGNTTTSTVNVTVDNTKPTVNLAAPTSGAPVSGTVNLAATASDKVGVTQVQFFVDNNTTPLGTDTSPDPTSGYYSASWNSATVSNGLHTLKVVAYDAAGNTTTSTVNVTVANPVTYNTTAIATGTAPTGVVIVSKYVGTEKVNYAYAADASSNTVTVIDTRTNTVSDTIDVGTAPLREQPAAMAPAWPLLTLRTTPCR